MPHCKYITFSDLFYALSNHCILEHKLYKNMSGPEKAFSDANENIKTRNPTGQRACPFARNIGGSSIVSTYRVHVLCTDTSTRASLYKTKNVKCLCTWVCDARRHHLTQPEQCARAHLVHTYTHTHTPRRMYVYVYMLCPSYINNDSLHSKMADRQLHPNQTLRLRTAAVAVKNPRARARTTHKNST